MSVDLTTGIVRILKPDGSTAGTGFVVSADGLIATCAHVVNLTGAKPGELIHLVFPISHDYHEAKIEPDYWRADNSEDVAIVRLIGMLPDRVSPLLLGSSFGIQGHFGYTFGFPLAFSQEGVGGKCEIIARITQAGYPVLQLRSTEVTTGFSGAPVLDESTQRVVGMVTSISTVDQYGKLAETAFVTCAETLRAICLELTLSDVCPYRSLEAFREEDADFFFGRQSMIDRLLQSLKHEPRFLAILGPSGCGKSSLVQAGLIPKLRSRFPFTGVPANVIITRPTDWSFGKLEIQTSSNTHLQTDQQLAENVELARLILVIDQFEELFVSYSNSARDTFLADLTRSLEGSIGITVIICMRNDFYRHFAENAPSLLDWLERALVNITPYLDADELAAIITEPLRLIGHTMESGLDTVIIRDAIQAAPAVSEPGQKSQSTILPLVEFALTRLWKARQDGVLTHETYKEMGGVTGGLTQWADRFYYQLSPEQRLPARRILTELVHLGDETIGLPDNRIRKSLDELCSLFTDRDVGLAIVQELANARLLVTARNTQESGEFAELIHEALIQEWKLLRSWLDQDRRFLLWRQNLHNRANAWHMTNREDPNNRDPEKLLRGRDLLEAKFWLEHHESDLSPLDRQYIRISLLAQSREAKAKRGRLLITSGTIIIVMLIIGRLLTFASHEHDIALSRRLAADAESTLHLDPARSLALAYEAVQRDPSDQAITSLRHTLLESHLRQTLNSGYRTNLDPAEVFHVAFSPNGQFVSCGPNAHVWDITSGKEMPLPDGVRADVKPPIFSPDSRYIFAYHTRNWPTVPGIDLWEVKTGRCIIKIQYTEDNSYMPPEFSADTRFVLIKGSDGTRHVWDLELGFSTLHFFVQVNPST